MPAPRKDAAPQLSLQRIEDLAAAEGRHRVPHRHPFHCEVMWIEAGTAEAYIEGRVYRLRAGDLYGLPNGVVHACGASETLRGWSLHCLPEYLAERSGEVLRDTHRGNLRVGGPMHTEVARFFESFLAEYAHVRPGRGNAVRAHLQMLGVHLRRLATKPDATAKSRPVSAAFRDLLDGHYAQERNPVIYAAQLGITADQLNHALRSETGAAARAHIDRRVTLEAQRLLAFTGIPVQDVGRKLGFDDPHYFSKYFRKHAGETAGEWRARQRQSFDNAGAPGLELPF